MKKLIIMVLCYLAFVCGGSEVQASGYVDWENNIVIGEGHGLPAEWAMDTDERQMTSYEAAKMDAYASLLEVVDGIRIDKDVDVKNLRLSSSAISGRISGMIHGARVMEVNYTESGACIMKLKMDMHGNNALMSAVMQPKTKTEAFLPVPVTGTVGNASYTGLIIDCRGLQLEPVMSPVIYSDSNEKIYGYENLDYSFVIKNGMASYVYSESAAVRSGSNPLIVKAIAVKGNNSNPVVAENDAYMILRENTFSHFLDRCAVVFIR